MKKFVALLLVLSMASIANATVIDVIPTKLNGTAVMPDADMTGVVANDEVQFALHLVDNDSMTPSYPSYDGYWLKGMDLMLTVTGKGDLDQLGVSPPPNLMQHNSLFGAWADPTTVGDPLVTGNKIYKLSGASQANNTSGIGSDASKRGYTEIVWNLKVTLHSDFVSGDIILIDLALNDDPLAGSSFYTNQPSYWGETYDIENRFMTNADFGDLTLGVPEPMTIALLGLGGLGLIYRRRRA